MATKRENVQPTTLKGAIQELSTMVTHPAFRTLVGEIEQCSKDTREDMARRLFTLQELTKRRIPVPDRSRIEFRISGDCSSEDIVSTRVATLSPAGPSYSTDSAPAAPGPLTQVALSVCGAEFSIWTAIIDFFTSDGGDDDGGTTGGPPEDPDPVSAGDGTGDDDTTGGG